MNIFDHSDEYYDFSIMNRYYPMLRMGAAKWLSIFSVFFFSAAFHELIISVPFRYMRVSYDFMSAEYYRFYLFSFY